jgi:hypothetical protein
MVLTTPYYRTIIEVPVNTCVELNDVSYTPYNIFCLMSRFQYWVSKQNKDYIASPISTDISGRMILTIRIFYNNNQVVMSEEEEEKYQKQINRIINNHPNHCLLIHNNSFPQYPVNWINSMIPYLSIEQKYQPFIIDGSLLIDLSFDKNFDLIYDKITYDIIKQINTFYDQGSLVTTEDFAKEWGMQKYNKDLYKSIWFDPFLASDRILFYYERLSHLPYKFEIGDNFVARHYVAKAVPNGVFDGKYYYIADKTFGYINALEISNKIQSALRLSEGKVSVMYLTDINKSVMLERKILSFYPKSDIVVYQIRDHLRPYAISFTIPIDANQFKIVEILSSS